MLTQNELKQSAARAAIDYITPKLYPNCVVGVGTGSTASYFIEYLSTHKDRFAGAVSSSEASSNMLKQCGIPLLKLEALDSTTIDFYVDGADEVNSQLEMIKGGGGALTREKIVAACAEQFICIADESKWKAQLGTFPLPIEVIPMAQAHVAQELERLGGKPRIRSGFTTDNGNLIIDTHDLVISKASALEGKINQITGVVSNGLFARRPADLLLLSTQSGLKMHKHK